MYTCTIVLVTMSLVVDTSVIISILTNEAHKSHLIELTRDEELIAPESLHFEIGNAFSAMLKRNRITIKLARKALEYYYEIPIRLVEVDLEKSLELSHKYNIYAYDSYFILAAINHKSEMLTLDQTLAEVAKKEQIRIREIKK